MSWFAIYQLENGQLVSGTGDISKIANEEILKARGYGVIECPDNAQAGIWNSEKLNFDPALSVSIYAEPEAIIAAFTPTEWMAARDLTDPNIVWWFDRLMSRREPVDIMGETFIQGLQYLVSQVKIDPKRTSEIISKLTAGI
jgi:hypothetical protein